MKMQKRSEEKKDISKDVARGTVARGRLKWPLSVVYFWATLCTFPDNSLGTLPAGLAPT